MLIGILANVRVIYAFMDDIKMLMDDNLLSYQFQEALKEEVQAFQKYVRNRTPNNENELRQAQDTTSRFLNQLPDDYEQIGDARYAITWNIQNSYEVYQKQRDKVLTMTGEEANYITNLYDTYKMQGYLQDYAMRLMNDVLKGGSTYYESQVLVLRRVPYVILISSIISLVILFLLSGILTRKIVTVLSSLIFASKKIEQNDFSIQDVAGEGEDEFGQLVYAFNKMKHATENHVHMIEEKRLMEEQLFQQELEKSNLEQQFAKAQLQLIKSQLNPHFLFNTLNMITRMAQMEDASVSQEMLAALSNLLRYSLRTTAAFTPLNQELKIVEDYMYIQKMRFGDRITWEVDCEVNAEAITVLVFLLQPLVENAIIHGISMKEEGGNVKVTVKQGNDEELLIEVADTGLGMSTERLEEIRSAVKQRKSGSGIGIGLGNIYHRIAAYYEQGNVMIDSVKGQGTSIKIFLGRRKVEGGNVPDIDCGR